MIKSHVKTKKGREPIIAYDVEEVKLPMLTFKPLQRNHQYIDYSTDYFTLDTETAHTDLVTGWIYQWAVKIKKTYIYGRTPSELIKLLRKMSEYYRLTPKKRVIGLIHNLSYDVQYLKHYLREYDPKAKFLAIDTHSIIIVDVFGFRLICSYKLSNMGLAALADNYAETYDKAVGEIDYGIVRYQDDELTPQDWFYMFSDVAAQYDGVFGYLKAMGYKYMFEAPFTSTGFVRTACRKASQKDPKWRLEFEAGALSLEQYNLCRWAFAGGVCIASFLYAGHTVRLIDGHVYVDGDLIERGVGLGHKDFTSSYPARQMMDYFPTGAPSWYGEIDDMDELEELLETRCCIFSLTLYDVHIRPGITAPCIASSKCIGLVSPVRLNGKIVHAKQLTIAVTEIDYKWIKRQYTAENIKVDKMLTFKRGKMPEWLKAEVMTYFRNKSTLRDTSPLLYAKSKNFLNSIYGMTATSLVRPQYDLDDDYIITEKKPEDLDAENEKQLKKYYKSRNSFMAYQYAVYTTSWARDALFTMAECVGYENFLYCDTDSVFYIETEENRVRMAEYTEQCKQRAIAAGAYVDNNYLGMPTDEPPIRAFRALHSKCYAMEEYKKKKGAFELTVVIAGIPKKSIKWENGEPKEKTNAEELGNIDNLVDGFTFKHNGGTRCVYAEQPPEVRNINGHITELASSAVIENIEKEISNYMYSVEGMNLLKLQQEQL